MDTQAKIEKVEEHIREIGILYNDRKHLPEDMDGCYKCKEGREAILVDCALSKKDKLIALLEELGHHYTSAGHLMPGDASIIEMYKQERTAIRWAIEYLIQPEDFILAFQSGVRNQYECAEYFGVPEDFLAMTVRIYREKYGYSLKVSEEYEIVFLPYFAVHRVIP